MDASFKFNSLRHEQFIAQKVSSKETIGFGQDYHRESTVVRSQSDPMQSFFDRHRNDVGSSRRDVHEDHCDCDSSSRYTDYVGLSR